MAFADPTTITVAGTAYTLPRVVTNPMASVYQDPTGTVKIDVKQQLGKVIRSVARVDLTEISTDPLTDHKLSQLASAYMVIQRPAVGFTPAKVEGLAVSLATWLTKDSNANLKKLIGLES